MERMCLVLCKLALTVIFIMVGSMAKADEASVPLIDNKLYPMAMKLEITPMYTFSFNDKYTHHTGGVLVAGFHPLDFLGVEVYGGYNLNGFGELNGISGWPSALRSGWTSLTDAIDVFTHSADASDTMRGKPLELPDLYYQTWVAGGNVMFAPFYGKWSVVSELGGSMYVYGLAGAGVAGTTKKDSSQQGTLVQGPIVVPVHYGIGTRIYFTKWLAFRAEIRDYWWINPEVQEQDSSGSDPCPGGYCLTVDGEKQQFTDFARTTMLQVGVSFILL